MKNQKHLLPVVDRYFKANLHTHSTISDGKLSPAEVKEAYKSKGYQILALTDHKVIVDHSHMTEPDFLMLTGIEVNYNDTQTKPGYYLKTYHLNLIAKRPDNLWTPVKPAPSYLNSHAYFPLENYEEMDTCYDPESVNAMIARANEMGFLVMYNHPTWSGQRYPEYAPLKGLWGMELRNSECCLLGHNENNTRVFTDLLNLGNKVFPLGTDDLHQIRALGLSWIMVGAQELRYDSVIDALEKGDFYMSCGPEIHSLTLEDNILRISCSDAQHILLETHSRFARRAQAVDGAYLREAEFDLTKLFEQSGDIPEAYFRLTVTAPDGTYAATRGYYLQEL